MQHVAKIPEILKGKNDEVYAYARFQLSCRLLGRFLNGTLYNIFCAGTGWVISNVLLRYSYSYFLHANLWYWNFLVFILIAVLIGVPLIILPFLGPKRTKKLKAKLEKLKLWKHAKPSASN